MTFNLNKKDILPLIESTLLKPDVLEADIINLCEEAKKHSFSGVCVHPVHVRQCAKLLKDVPYRINVNTVISYPFGGDRLPVKIKAIKDAFKEGASHVDVVLDVAMIKAGRWEQLAKEVAKLVKTGGTKRGVKLVLCTELLTKEEINRVCEIAVNAKARFIRNTTEFSDAPLDFEIVSFIDDCVAHWLRVRGDDMYPCVLCASGARSYSDALSFASVKAQRIGTMCANVIAEQAEALMASRIEEERVAQPIKRAEPKTMPIGEPERLAYEEVTKEQTFEEQPTIEPIVPPVVQQEQPENAIELEIEPQNEQKQDSKVREWWEKEALDIEEITDDGSQEPSQE